MIQFPIKALLSEEECHDYLEHTLHPEGLRCPRSHPLPVGQAPTTPDGPRFSNTNAASAERCIIFSLERSGRGAITTSGS